MDVQHLATLEFPKVLKRLARFASFSASELLARTLAPATNAEEIRQRLATTSEARLLLEANPAIGVAGARDVRPLVTSAERGRVLRPAELLDIQSTLRSSRSLRSSLTRSKKQYPLLAAIAATISPNKDISKEIDRCIDEVGGVGDSASPELSRLRRQVHLARVRIKDKLQSIIQSPRNSRFLQEPVVTQRDGRHVIPLKSDFRGRIPGVVHDSSSSGSTLFIEPLAVVELNNSCRELELAEQEEVERILAALSALVAANAADITRNVEALADLDLAFAKAQYAEDLEASQPELVPFASGRRTKEGHPGSTVRFSQARHPLLDPRSVVPIDVILDEETFILVITGPNTGGKTVALKTVGLLAAMAQSGLHIPVTEGSAFSPFDAIYVDIGDEQSIEQSLSTFSSHLTNILSFLDDVDSHSLLLLDELGAGTDPTEGAALARALLDHFRARSSTAFVATHYPALKAYAQLTPGVRNACVEFDPESLSPTYRLTIGLPGRSNALSIAERIGLPKEIADSARSSLSRQDVRTDDMLADIHNLRLQAATARDEVAASRTEAQQQVNELRERLANIETERQELLAAAREKADTELEVLRSEIRSLRNRLRTAVAPLDALAEVEKAVDELQEDLPSAEPLDLALPVSGAVPEKEGDPVFIRTLGVHGRILSINGDQAVVQLGPARGRFALRSLELAPEKAASPPPSPAPTRFPSAASPSHEIQVRGLTIDEALPMVDRHVDAAFLAGLPSIRVVHGKGTGALRKAIRKALRSHPLVTSLASGRPAEGGNGVTIVKLASR